MEKYLVVKADTNDADYITQETKVDDTFDIKRLSKIMKVINANRGRWETHDWTKTPPTEMYKDKISEEDIEWFSDCVPHGEHGVHTIESVELINKEVIKSF